MLNHVTHMPSVVVNTDADLAYLCSGLFSPSCPLVSLGLFGNSISDQASGWFIAFLLGVRIVSFSLPSTRPTPHQYRVP